MSLFWVDPIRNLLKTEEDLLSDLQNIRITSRLVNDENPYWGIVKFLKLTYNKERCYFLEDSSLKELSAEELLVDDSNFQSPRQYVQLLEHLEPQKNLTGIFLSTSGTTGRPKIVEQNLGKLSKRVSLRYLNKSWGLVYHPYHIAGIQIILQAFYSRSSLIYFSKDAYADFEKYLRQFRITNIASTPTFLNLVVSSISPYLELETYTLGGERVKDRDYALAQEKFPNAKISSIYASTEAGSLFATKSHGVFVIPQNILDKVQISSEGLLLIHRSLLGKGTFSSDEWYNTYDVVERLTIDSFRIVGRVSDFINVGGYKVDPHKVEGVLMNHPCVEKAIVNGRPNKVTGNLVVAEVLLKKNADPSTVKGELLQACREELMEWEIPRMINFVSELKVGSTGKAVRV